MAADKAEKLQQLVDDFGYDSDLELFQAATFDSVCPGICMNEDCDYSTEVEPDCSDGYCEICDSQTVKSGLILGDMI
jgi:hypothetical protein